MQWLLLILLLVRSEAQVDQGNTYAQNFNVQRPDMLESGVTTSVIDSSTVMPLPHRPERAQVFMNVVNVATLSKVQGNSNLNSHERHRIP
jgi:hypothetical protein